MAAKFAWLRCKVRRDGVEGVDSRTSLLETSSTTSSSSSGKSKPAPPHLWGDDLYVAMEEKEELYRPAIRQVTLTEPYYSENDDDDDEASPDRTIHGGLQQVLQEESVQEWHDEDPTQPVWRVTLVTWQDHPNKFALVLAFHHLITDGTGALQVARAIVGPDDDTPLPDDEHASSRSHSSAHGLPPPMEDVLDTAPTVGHMVRLLFWHSFPTLQRWWYPSHWRGNAVHRELYAAPTKDRATELVCCASLVDDVDALRTNYCRRHNLSLNSVLVATLLRAVTQVVAVSEQQHAVVIVALAALSDSVGGGRAPPRLTRSAGTPVGCVRDGTAVAPAHIHHYCYYRRAAAAAAVWPRWPTSIKANWDPRGTRRPWTLACAAS